MLSAGQRVALQANCFNPNCCLSSRKAGSPLDSIRHRLRRQHLASLAIWKMPLGQTGVERMILKMQLSHVIPAFFLSQLETWHFLSAGRKKTSSGIGAKKTSFLAVYETIHFSFIHRTTRIHLQGSLSIGANHSTAIGQSDRTTVLQGIHGGRVRFSYASARFCCFCHVFLKGGLFSWGNLRTVHVYV